MLYIVDEETLSIMKSLKKITDEASILNIVATIYITS